MKGSRSLRIAITIAIAGLLGACSPVPTPVPTPTRPPTPAATASPGTYKYADIVVGFIQSGSRGAWQAANTTSFIEAAAEMGVDLRFYDAAGQFADQIAAFHRFTADPAVNVIVLAAVQGTGYDDVLREARAAGKVVIIESRRIGADQSLYHTYVGPDREGEGQRAAAAMCDLLGNSKKRGVAEISGPPADANEIDVARGFREKMSDCGITVPNVLTTTDTVDVAESTASVSALLGRIPDIQGIFAHSDEQAIGAIRAIEAAGLKPGKAIQLVSIGAGANAFQYLISGELGAAVERNPLLGPQVYSAALRALNNDTSWRSSGPQEGVFFASLGPELLRQILQTRKY